MSFFEILNTPIFNVLSACSGAVLLRAGAYFWKHRNDKTGKDEVPNKEDEVPNKVAAIACLGLGVCTLICTFLNIWF